MKLTRPLIFLDIESATAKENHVDPQHDRIVAIAAMKFSPRDDWDTEPLEMFDVVKPGIPINKKCSEIHGYTDETVKDKPPFSTIAQKWHDFIGGADLGGYNVWGYDLPIVVAEMERCGLSLCWRSRHVFDPCVIFKKHEERTLTAAAMFYCGVNHEEAHGAMPDTVMAFEVFKAQLKRYETLAKMDPKELHRFCQHDERLTLDGKIAKGPDGDPIYTFGKVKGAKVKDDLGFADWMLYKASFPRDTTEWLEAYKQSLQSASEKDYEDAQAEREFMDRTERPSGELF